MDFIIKETRAEYKITQKELSEITDIPLRTIENWESGKRTPSPWVEKMVYSYLKKYPKNKNGIITETKGMYEVEQIKEALLPLTLKHDIKLIIFENNCTIILHSGKHCPSVTLSNPVESFLSFFT